jgi:hypothetical protein
VTIDGKALPSVDLYAADVKWQAQQTFCCFSDGRHSIAIRVTGKTNWKSAGRFVDLDSFVVR